MTLHMDRCIHPSVVPFGYIISIRHKCTLNLRLQEEICAYLKCFSAKGYLKDYWYDFKYLTHSLHVVYRLLYKIILTFGENGMANRCKYHHLVYDPRTIAHNLQIYKCLVKFLDVQLGIMGPKFLSQSSRCNISETAQSY